MTQSQSLGRKTSCVLDRTAIGAPFLHDLLDIFAALMLSMELKTHKIMFCRYEHSFLRTDAIASLSFLQVVRKCSRVTYRMPRDSAVAVFKLCLAARLLAPAVDSRHSWVTPEDVFTPTPKGLHIVECYARDSGVDARHLDRVFAAWPVCPRLLHFVRRQSDDKVALSDHTVLDLFRRFAGRTPNYAPANLKSLDPTERYRVWAKGIPITREVSSMSVRGRHLRKAHHDACFSAASAAEWLCDFTVMSGTSEASRALAHFVRLELLVLTEGKFVTGSRTTYRFTERGCQISWNISSVDMEDRARTASPSAATG
ncbi:hypothetical protein PHLGIDRAFT_96691, partial [Phlebiopsis gigantea 11061_1 CR5-6]